MNRRQLAADHVWIARYHAKRLAGTVDYWDLLSVGHLALIQAANRWPGKQAFVPYATSRIVWRMQDTIRRAVTASSHRSEMPTVEMVPNEEEGVYYVRDWIDRLSSDERKAVMMAYGIGTTKRTTGQIARSLKTTSGEASAIIRSGLLRLRFMATVEQCDGP